MMSHVVIHATGHTHQPHVTCSYIEVEELRLLLIGSSLGQTRLVQIAVGHAGLDRLRGRTVCEALRDVTVVQHRHVLQGGQGGAPGLLHLEAGQEMNLFFIVHLQRWSWN